MRFPLKSALFVLLFITGVICQDIDANSEFPQITDNDQPEEIENAAAPKPHIQPGAPEIVVEPGPQKVDNAEAEEKPVESQGTEVTLAKEQTTEEPFPDEVTEQDPFATTAAPELLTTKKVVVVDNVETGETTIKEGKPEIVMQPPTATKPDENQKVEENPSQAAPESPPVSPVVIEEASVAPESHDAPESAAAIPVEGETSVPDITAPETGPITEAPKATEEDPTAMVQNNDDDVFAGDKSIFQQESTMKVLTERLPTAPVESATEAAAVPAITVEPVFPRIELPTETGEDKEEDIEPKAVVVTVKPLEPQDKTESPLSTDEKDESEGELPFAPSAASFMPESQSEMETTPAMKTAEHVPIVPVVAVMETTPAPEPSPEPTAEPIAPEVVVTEEPKAEPEPSTVVVVTGNENVVTPTAEPIAPEVVVTEEPKAEPEPSTSESVIVVAGNENTPTAEPEPEPSTSESVVAVAGNENIVTPTAEPIAEPEPSTPQPEPSNPQPEPEPEPSAEPEPEPSTTPFVAIDEHHNHHQHAIVSPAVAAAPIPIENPEAHRMPFSLRFPNIEYNDEFHNPQSGSFKKLNEQIGHDYRKVLKKVLGDNFIDYEVSEMRPGSVIVEGRILTKQEIMDAEGVVEQVQQVIDANGGTLGGNQVDTKSITVNGFVSKGNVEQVSDPAATKTGLVIFAAIGIGFLIIAAVIVAIIIFGIRKRNAKRDSIVMNRRNNGSMKLKENIDLAENGRSSYQPPGNVNLMGYGSGNGSTSVTTNGSSTDNGKTGMVMNSSQFSSPTALQTTST